MAASSIILNIEGEICFDKLTVAEKFNSFYTTVASKLVEKFHRRVSKFGKKIVAYFIVRKVLRQIVFHFLSYQKINVCCI